MLIGHESDLHDRHLPSFLRFVCPSVFSASPACRQMTRLDAPLLVATLHCSVLTTLLEDLPHPLNGKGSAPYTAQRVVNSRWIKELEAINSVHHGYRPEMWRELNHYIFWFHDSTFECVAQSFKVEVHRLRFREVLGLMVERLNT